MLVRVLGPLAVEMAALPADEAALGGPRQQTVLACLVMNADREVAPSTLVDAVWPDDPPPAAAGTLQAYVSRLRRVLGKERLVRSAGGYRLGLGRDELDEWVLADAVSAASTDGELSDDALVQLTDAVGLWRGRPLGELSAELFAGPYVASLEDLHARAVAVLASSLLARDEPMEAVAVLRRAVMYHPHHAELARLLMAGLQRSRRPDEALMAYRQFAARLQRDLGLSPDPEVRRLAAVVAATDPSARAAVAAQQRRARAGAAITLPDPVGVFVGRVEERAAVVDRLSQWRLVTLVGAPGSGKSRLALEAAWAASSRFVGGAGLVDVEGVGDPAGLLSAIGQAFGVQQQAGLSLATALRRGLAARGRMLILLDAAERLNEDAIRTLAALLNHCEELSFLVTSQQALDLPEESALDVGPLSVPDDAEALLDSDAGRLLVERARAAQPGFTVTPRSRPVLAEIARHLDGLPLALELAAGQLAVLGPTELARRLADRFSVLVKPGSSGSHVSLRAALASALDELDPIQRMVLERLGVTGGPVPLWFAERLVDDLCQRAGVHPRVVLGALARRSLLTMDERGVTTLESVRAYCAQRLADSQQLETALLRHGETLATALKEAAADYHGPRQGQAAALVGAVAAETHAAVGRLPEASATRLAGLAAPWWYRAGQLDRLAMTADRLVPPAGLQADADTMRLAGFGALAYATSERDWVRAQALADQAVAIAAGTEDEAAGCEARLLRADVGTVIGAWQQAADDLAWVLTNPSTQPWMIALAHLRRMRVEWALGPAEPADAQRRREEAAAAVRQSGDPALLAYLRLTRGNILGHHGQLRTAQGDLTDVVRVFEQIEHYPFLSLSTLLLAQVTSLRGDWDQAGTLAQRVLQVGQGTAAPFPVDPREILARAHAERGDQPTAVAILNDLLDEARSRGHTALIAVVGNDLATMLLDEDPTGARAALADLPPTDQTPVWQQLDLAVTQATIDLADGHVEPARRTLADARVLLPEQPLLVEQSRLCLAEAQLHHALDNPLAAADSLAEHDALREASGYVPPRWERERRHAAFHRCRQELGDAALAQAWRAST